MNLKGDHLSYEQAGTPTPENIEAGEFSAGWYVRFGQGSKLQYLPQRHMQSLKTAGSQRE